MDKPRSSLWCAVWLVIATLTLPLCGHADLLRTQTITLTPGWNAVFLEVEPPDSDPAVVFAHTAIDIAAAYYTPVAPAQFMTDPSADMLRQTGWGVWYAPDRPDAFLSSLHAIHGKMGYLLHATTNVTWEVTGNVTMPGIEWQPNRFNLVGFGVDPQAPPSFGQFFAGVPACDHNRIYRLVEGGWRRVLDPAAEVMRSGEAFWMYCQGASDYMGPVTVETQTRDGLVLGTARGELILRNRMPHPVAVTLAHVPTGPLPVPLALVIQALGDSRDPVQQALAPLPDGAWTQDIPPLEAGVSIRVPFVARVADMTSPWHTSLLHVTTDMGTETWIPITGLREDLEDD